MTDYFQLLGQRRQPWLDGEKLKQVFLAISAEIHPDRSHHLSDAKRIEAGERFSELNAAYNCLREPKERLRHLLELERRRKPADVQGVPAYLMDWQFKIASVCREADKALAVDTAGMSPLLKVNLFEAAQGEVEKLAELQESIRRQTDELLAALHEMNGPWQSPAVEAQLDKVEEIYRALGYFSRWSGQLHERVVQLNLQSL